MTENIIMAKDYNKIDGKKAYRSKIKEMSLSLSSEKEEGLLLKIWQENLEGNLEIASEMPLNQVMDSTILLLRTMQYVGEAYRFPNFYDEKNPKIDRIGLQGDVMPIEVNVKNSQINQEMKEMAQVFSDFGELTGERLRVMKGLLEELGYY